MRLVFGLASMIAMGFLSFGSAVFSQSLLEKKENLQEALSKEREELRVLATDWSYLTRSDRLALLVEEHMDLHPLALEQLVPIALDPVSLDPVSLDPRTSLQTPQNQGLQTQSRQTKTRQAGL